MKDIEPILVDAAERLSIPFGEKLHFSDISFYSFPQSWGSTTLGFGGAGGQTMTCAQTWVCEAFGGGMYAVYFGGKFAYMVTRPNNYFFECLRGFRMPSKTDAYKLQD